MERLLDSFLCYEQMYGNRRAFLTAELLKGGTVGVMQHLTKQDEEWIRIANSVGIPIRAPWEL